MNLEQMERSLDVNTLTGEEVYRAVSNNSSKMTDQELSSIAECATRVLLIRAENDRRADTASVLQCLYTMHGYVSHQLVKRAARPGL